MSYGLDIVLNIMDKLSDSKMSYFERDSSLFIVSKEGFAQIPLNPTMSLNLDKVATSVITGRDKENNPILIPDEEKHFKPIMFGPDSMAFSLEDMIEIADKLSKIKDDQNIRMVAHDSVYHSHKHGYANDGQDILVIRADVMKRREYLDIIRKNEENFYKRLKEIVEQMRKQDRPLEEAHIPVYTIFTPHVVLSLPDSTYLNIIGNMATSWDTSTRFYGSVVKAREISTCRGSPYELHLIVNAQELGVNSTEEENSNGNKLVFAAEDALKEHIDAIKFAMSTMRDDNVHTFLDYLNDIHNKVFAESIGLLKGNRKKK